MIRTTKVTNLESIGHVSTKTTVDPYVYYVCQRDYDMVDIVYHRCTLCSHIGITQVYRKEGQSDVWVCEKCMNKDMGI